MSQTKEFMALFAGLPRAYGTYEITDERDSGKKVGKAITRREPVTEALWEMHLAGKQNLGIVPIRDDNTVVFGAIDIDCYKDFDIVALAAKAHALGMAILICRSKSGGAHCYLFASEPVSARLMRARLAEFARLLEYPKAEIFPKQEKLPHDANAVGGWINMPYANAAGNCTRFQVLPDGSRASSVDFLARAKALAQPAAWFETPFVANEVQGDGDPFAEGPPCIQKLVQIGVPEGTRDNFGLNLVRALSIQGTVNGVEWQDRFRETMRKVCDPPLPSEDIDRLIKQAKREYNYTCTREPLAEHCNSAVCRIRKFGVGRMESLSGKKSDIPEMPVMGGLRKLDTDPPIFYLEVEGQTVKLNATQLASPRLFQVRCMEAVNKPIPIISQAGWHKILVDLFENIVITEVPDEEKGPRSTFRHLLEHYLTRKAPAQHKEQVATGNPWTDENHMVWFNLEGLLRFLAGTKTEGMTKAAVTAYLHEIGAENKRFRDVPRQPWVWGVPELEDRRRPDTVSFDEFDEVKK